MVDLERAEGGKTGLTAMTTGIFFFISVFFAPIFASLPSWATGGALVIVGTLMARNVREINWDYMGDAVPAFLTIIIIPLSYKYVLYLQNALYCGGTDNGHTALRMESLRASSPMFCSMVYLGSSVYCLATASCRQTIAEPNHGSSRPGESSPFGCSCFLVLVALRLLSNQSLLGNILMVTLPVVPIHHRITALILDIPPIPTTITPRKRAIRLTSNAQWALLSKLMKYDRRADLFFLFHFRRTMCTLCDYTLHCTFFWIIFL